MRFLSTRFGSRRWLLKWLRNIDGTCIRTTPCNPPPRAVMARVFWGFSRDAFGFWTCWPCRNSFWVALRPNQIIIIGYSNMCIRPHRKITPSSMPLQSLRSSQSRIWSSKFGITKISIDYHLLYWFDPEYIHQTSQSSEQYSSTSTFKSWFCWILLRSWVSRCSELLFLSFFILFNCIWSPFQQLEHFLIFFGF